MWLRHAEGLKDRLIGGAEQPHIYNIVRDICVLRTYILKIQVTHFISKSAIFETKVTFLLAKIFVPYLFEAKSSFSSDIGIILPLL